MARVTIFFFSFSAFDDARVECDRINDTEMIYTVKTDVLRLCIQLMMMMMI